MVAVLKESGPRSDRTPDALRLPGFERNGIAVSHLVYKLL